MGGGVSAAKKYERTPDKAADKAVKSESEFEAENETVESTCQSELHEFEEDEEEQKVREQKRQDEQEAKLRGIFTLWDTNNDSYIDANELETGMASLGFDPKADEIQKMIKEVGCLKPGHISWAEFKTIMKAKMEARARPGLPVKQQTLEYAEYEVNLGADQSHLGLNFCWDSCASEVYVSGYSIPELPPACVTDLVRIEDLLVSVQGVEGQCQEVIEPLLAERPLRLRFQRRVSASDVKMTREYYLAASTSDASYGEIIHYGRCGLLTDKELTDTNTNDARKPMEDFVSYCANRAFQVRIVQRGGWKWVILPLLMSLDEGCRKTGSVAIAHLSTNPSCLPGEDVAPYVVLLLTLEKSEEILSNLLLVVGNLACHSAACRQLQRASAADRVATLLQQAPREDIATDCLFCLANLACDPWHKDRMTGNDMYGPVWEYMSDPVYAIGWERRPGQTAEEHKLRTEPVEDSVSPYADEDENDEEEDDFEDGEDPEEEHERICRSKMHEKAAAAADYVTTEQMLEETLDQRKAKSCLIL